MTKSRPGGELWPILRDLWPVLEVYLWSRQKSHQRHGSPAWHFRTKVHAGAQCGKISVQAPCRVPLTSCIRQSIVGSHATATVGSRFRAAIAAAGFLHC